MQMALVALPYPTPFNGFSLLREEDLILILAKTGRTCGLQPPLSLLFVSHRSVLDITPGCHVPVLKCAFFILELF